MRIRKTDFTRTCALAFVAFVLAACAALGLPQPRDFADRASLAYDLAEQGVETVSAMLAAGELTPDDAANAIDQFEQYLQAVNVARALHAVSAADGEARLAAIRAGLDGLIDYLEHQGGGYDDHH